MLWEEYKIIFPPRRKNNKCDMINQYRLLRFKTISHALIIIVFL